MSQEAILTKIDGEVNISKSFEFMCPSSGTVSTV